MKTWNEFRSHIRHLSAVDQERIRKAFAFGLEAHKGQKRYSGEPYFTHPIAVADKLADIGGDADTIITGLLHDTVEDSEVPLGTIEKEFGSSVAKLIDGMTKFNYGDFAHSPSLDEKTETLRKIFTLMDEDARIMVIKLIDRLHNMQTIEFYPEEKQHDYAQETRDVFVKIADRLSMMEVRNELEALCMSILEPDLLEELLQLHTENEKRGNSVMIQMISELQDRDIAFPYEILFEGKTWQKLKILRDAGGKSSTGIADVVIAIICPHADDCYRALGALHHIWQRETLSFQDFINSPMINGYQGLHTTIIMEDGTRVRCKIRDPHMHEYAQIGIATKCFDGEAVGFQGYLPWSKQITPLSKDTTGQSSEFWDTLQSDILGEAITIHGSDDRTIMVPKDATVLDGAFYLFGKEALKANVIFINGKERSFSDNLANADSIDIEFSRRSKATRQWLEWAETGLAISTIRTYLSKQPKAKKMKEGREAIEQEFYQHRKGYMEEIEEEYLLKRLQDAGFQSIDELYTAIAEGRMDPSDMYSLVMQPGETPMKKRVHRWLVRYRCPLSDSDLVYRATHIIETFNQHCEKLDFHYDKKRDKGKARGIFTLNTADAERLKSLLTDAGVHQLTVLNTSLAKSLPLSIIVAIWGLDPVVAHVILPWFASSTNLAFIRFCTFFIASGLIYIWHRSRTKQKLRKLNIFDPYLLLTGASLFFTGICTYASLLLITPAQYMTIVAMGPVYRSIFRTQNTVSHALSLSTGIAVTVLLAWIYGTPLFGVLAGLGAGMGFVLYTEFSSRYQEHVGQIIARFPAYLFMIATVSMVLALTQIPNLQPQLLSPQLIGIGVFFCLIFVFLPYTVFYSFISRTQYDMMHTTALLACTVAMVGDLVVNQSLPALLMIPVLLSLVILNRIEYR